TPTLIFSWSVWLRAGQATWGQHTVLTGQGARDTLGSVTLPRHGGSWRVAPPNLRKEAVWSTTKSGLFFCLKAVPCVSDLFLRIRWPRWESTYGYGSHRHTIHAGRSAHAAGRRAIRVDRRPIGGAEYGSQIKLSCGEALAPAWIGHRCSGAWTAVRY